MIRHDDERQPSADRCRAIEKKLLAAMQTDGSIGPEPVHVTAAIMAAAAVLGTIRRCEPAEALAGIALVAQQISDDYRASEVTERTVLQ